MGNKTHKQDNMELPVLLVQDVFVALNNHLEYLKLERSRIAICMNKKEEYDKAVLDAKIALLKDRVERIRKQLAKRKN